ncbi:AraC family transcriptional regulator [Pseudomarimonas salicorniae]|uniref:AraC family transcriptional regulator n=1 Tax=Pseudomarimonas salicorniae TaxID=2933270 RepID=A0ABT0GES1_9GAMM|nr:AraC family transcriptional regulator [Lysobacter sp. CAU 1642]MCK7593045.1 AraC family transcriptional regulator [Lysobacter sp. CAU 1642]
MAAEEQDDALSAVLRRIGLRGHVYARPRICGDWQFSAAGRGQASYHLVSEGRCFLHMRHLDRPLPVSAGDLMFFPRDSWHALSALPRLEADGELRLPDADGLATRLVCGLYHGDDTEFGRLLRGLPDLVLLSAVEGGAALEPVVRMLAEEDEGDRPARGVLLDALSEVLLALVLRRAMEAGQIADGLLGALGDPRIAPVLSAIHAEPGRSWSLDTLAQLAALSRSRLTERFRELLDCSPLQYIAELRMREAGVLLRESQLSVAQIAERLGYATETAFRRAYRRVTGRTPGDARRAG